MKYRTGIVLALLLHIMILVVMTTIYWPNNQKVGMPSVNIMQSYVYAQKQSGQTLQQKQLEYTSVKANEEKQSKFVPVSASKGIKNSVNHKRMSDISEKTTQKLNNKRISKKSSIISNLTRGQYNQLLLLLHNAIAKNQVYPTNAQILHQQGTVILDFTLHVSGEITDIKIEKSSGFGLLDDAAIAAVQSINPFTAMKIQDDHQLDIEINFNL